MLRPTPAAYGLDTDVAIVQRILAGETALFERIMRRHNQRLFRAARAILNDASEAEDVMQEAYTRAFAHLAEFRGDAQLATWLTKIAVNEALARVRKRRRLAPLPAGDAVEALPMVDQPMPPDPEHEAHTAELRQLLERAIDELPESYRTVFVLREVEGLSTATTAECLGVSEEVVKTRLSRARMRLRDGLYARAGAVASEAFPFGGDRCDRIVAAVLPRLTLGDPTR